MIVGIAGMSRSGKTTLAQALAKCLHGKVCVLHLDDFVFAEDTLPTIKNGSEIRTDWEDPTGIDFDFISKKAIEAHRNHDWVILEGFLLFHDAKIRALCSKKIMLQISHTTFYTRRKPTYTPQEPDWYIQHVWDTYQKLHVHFEKHLDALILPERETEKLKIALDFLIS